MGSFGGRRSGTSPATGAAATALRGGIRDFVHFYGISLLTALVVRPAVNDGRSGDTGSGAICRPHRATAAPQRAIYIKTQPAQAWLASTQSGTLFFLGMGSFGVRREARRERWTVRGGVHFTVTPFCTCAQQFAVKKRGAEGRKRPCFVIRVSCFVFRENHWRRLVRSGKKFLTAGEALSRRDTWRGLWSRRPRHELYMVQ